MVMGNPLGGAAEVHPLPTVRLPVTEPPVQSYWDRLVGELHAYRDSVGKPSFGAIADRIAERREADGISPAAARVSRSTVYDTFRYGRSKLNLILYREIAVALGAHDRQVDEWLRRNRLDDQTPDAHPPPTSHIFAVLAGCLALNLLGRLLVDGLHMQIYLDMVGTAIAAIAVGPWRGAAVGVMTNVLGVVVSGWTSIPFALVNVCGALVWGYGVRRFGMGGSMLRFFALNLIVAVACSMVAIPILLALLGESFRGGQGTVTEAILEYVPNIWIATGLSNVLTSSADKIISGFAALAAIVALPAWFRSPFPLAQHVARLGRQSIDLNVH